MSETRDAPAAPGVGPNAPFVVCPSCGGGRSCWLCKGTGVLSTGALCRECLGRKTCLGCEGAGVVPKG